VKKSVLLLSLILLLGVLLQAGIVVKQEKDGRIVVSNTIDPWEIRKDNGGIRFYRPDRSISIPASYLKKIQELADTYQLRKDMIIAVAKAESSFNPFATSPKGAAGIMQLMDGTARQYGVVNRYNVNQNLEAGVQHLKYLYQRFDEDIPLTLAAYNAGEDAVLKYKGVPPFGETRRYIHRVMSYMGLTYHPSSKSKIRTKIYKYTTREGRVVISDTLPVVIDGQIEIIE